MRGLLLLTTLLVPAHLTVAWSTKYAVDCPERCDNAQCRSSILRCKRLVLDDCSCCPVCAAGPGETCYRTVSGMDGVKCGPGLRCQFYNEEDDFGDEFGICKECPYGTYGMECKETCNCQSGICDRVTGECLKFRFFHHPAVKSPTRTLSSPAEREVASGDGNTVREEIVRENPARSPVMKWLNPR
uniref:endothelial cell-specific molecule 1 n=1 Tax=Jaculus jaculus TaxID=51337 RepID=UPI001E1B50D5|nr:endothelial cell-specific molecule 1 [Jaculus jaculus]